MVISRRDLLKGFVATAAAGILMPTSLLAGSNDITIPEFIPSYPLNLSAVSSFRAQTQRAKTDTLERLPLNAIIDPTKGRIIGEFDPQILIQPIDPASLTKIVTFMIIQDFLRLGQTPDGKPFTLKTKLADVTLLNGDFLKNDDLTVEDGLNYIMGRSNNQIASSLAITLAGSEAAFVELMNAKVRSLGLANTRLMNASGLPGDERSELFVGNDDYSNVSTLEDLCKLTVQAVRLYPEYSQYSKAEYELSAESILTRRARGQNPRASFASTNPLYKKRFKNQAEEFNIDGLKTGTTDILGRGIIVTGKKNGFRLAGLTAGHPVYREEHDDTKRPEQALYLLAENTRLLTFEAQKIQEFNDAIRQRREPYSPTIVPPV
ncbi:MAG: D-alanyl-D-alanine carboxypeptidase [Alphaproteobacteria bacterium]|nr:D-alanyl-D-alanine carboxypeptidase [Alphaproteobacteria bacterium]